jgi:hypothetical protein
MEQQQTVVMEVMALHHPLAEHLQPTLEAVVVVLMLLEPLALVEQAVVVMVLQVVWVLMELLI